MKSVHAMSRNSDTSYVILDSTQDSPGITSLLMALEASNDPTSTVKLLGAITTEGDGLEDLRQILRFSGLEEHIKLLSIPELDLYPVDGQFPEIPSTVQFLLDSVNEHPGQVTIYSSGSLTQIAMAEAFQPDWAMKVKEVLIVAEWVWLQIFECR